MKPWSSPSFPLLVLVNKLSLVLKAPHKVKTKISPFINLDIFFYRMQMNERVKLQGGPRILSIHLFSTSREIQRRHENKEWLFGLDCIFLYSFFARWLRVNQSSILSLLFSFNTFRSNKNYPESESWWRGGICKTFRMTSYSVREILNSG